MKALKYMMMGMLVSLTASCGNDWLDVESSTKIPTETAIQNLDDVEYSLNGIYDVMQYQLLLGPYDLLRRRDG